MRIMIMGWMLIRPRQLWNGCDRMALARTSTRLSSLQGLSGIPSGNLPLRDVPSGPIYVISTPASNRQSSVTVLLIAMIAVLLVFALAREQVRNAIELLKSVL